jgi:hypothetical protein
MRLFLRDQVLEFMEALLHLIETLLKRARSHRSVPMPGYTHYQPEAHNLGHFPFLRRRVKGCPKVPMVLPLQQESLGRSSGLRHLFSSRSPADRQTPRL